MGDALFPLNIFEDWDFHPFISSELQLRRLKDVPQVGCLPTYPGHWVRVLQGFVCGYALLLPPTRLQT